MNWALFQNSLVVAFSCAVLASIAGLLVALFSAGLSMRGRTAIVVLSILTFALPPFLVTNSWLHYFGLTGTLKHLLPFDLFSRAGTVLLVTLQLWPVVFGFAFHALLRIDRAYLDLDVRLRRVALFKHVIWPAVKYPLAQAAAIVFVLAINSFSVPALLQTKVYAAEVWLSFNTQFNYAEALRLSWPMIVTPLVLLAVIEPRAMPRLFRTPSVPGEILREKLGPIYYAAAVSALAVLLISDAFPLWQLLTNERTWTELSSAIAAGRNATLNALLFGAAPAAIVIAISLACASRAPAPVFSVIRWTLFLAPGVLLGIALIWIFNRPGFGWFYGGVGIVLLAYSLRFLALGFAGVRLVAAAIDRSPMDTVRVFGGSAWQQFRLAFWPQARPLIFALFFLVYLLCLWEVETLILIVPPGRETLALRIFNMLHYGHAGQVNALCLWLLAIALAPLLVYAIARNLRRVAPLLLCAIAFCGCSQPGNGTHINSALFSTVEVIGSRGTGAGQFNKPRSVALDKDDNLYVVDMTGRVQKFSTNGLYLLSWQMPQTDKGKPKGMVQDQQGNIILIEPHYSRVNHFDPTGHLLAQWGENGTNFGQLTFPRSVALNSRGEIYLSEYGLVERVLHFSPDGKSLLDVIGSGGTGPGEFNRAEGLGMGPDDALYVADSCNHRVQAFSSEGKLIGSFGNAGAGAGEMSYPYDVRVDASGLKFVCEFGNSRVQVFDSANRSLEIIGGPGGEPAQMNNPWAIALDSRGNLYVADSMNHRVQKFLRREPLPSRVPATTTKPGRDTFALRTK